MANGKPYILYIYIYGSYGLCLVRTIDVTPPLRPASLTASFSVREPLFTGTTVAPSSRIPWRWQFIWGFP